MHCNGLNQHMAKKHTQEKLSMGKKMKGEEVTRDDAP